MVQATGAANAPDETEAADDTIDPPPRNGKWMKFPISVLPHAMGWGARQWKVYAGLLRACRDARGQPRMVSDGRGGRRHYRVTAQQLGAALGMKKGSVRQSWALLQQQGVIAPRDGTQTAWHGCAWAFGGLDYELRHDGVSMALLYEVRDADGELDIPITYEVPIADAIDCAAPDRGDDRDDADDRPVDRWEDRESDPCSDRQPIRSSNGMEPSILPAQRVPDRRDDRPPRHAEVTDGRMVDVINSGWQRNGRTPRPPGRVQQLVNQMRRAAQRAKLRGDDGAIVAYLIACACESKAESNRLHDDPKVTCSLSVAASDHRWLTWLKARTLKLNPREEPAEEDRATSTEIATALAKVRRAN
jgi:hypothetical protein